ncbi:NAD(P)H-dependent FMN reductase [Quadrisphaera granulorum]|uniref:NAD(P)H-dependent FMN reductase n=1 Tax=Quadrisphaera granulorum TaxID=317664 RepID=A0A315ZQG9_9ACTN|nr:NAD(P)H-dependent oxidoreductase [Quadrisphaera granulorum]PWJ46904.1 NAD(P)H-dependent FMN reductase [Quadrisphaera granulorum]SZE98996.1 NAD(P)H-dependent FMN reductase [Quadrisphaera granulorum]
MTRIAIITGSTRPGRRSDVIAHWALQSAANRADADFALVDLAEHDLPHLDEPVAAAMSADYRHEHTRRWAETIASFDGYVFVTPEYNHGTTGVLKNAIDYLYTEWHDKAAGFISYGTHGGVRAVEHLRLVMAEVHVADVRAQVSLSLFTDFTGQNFTPAPHHTRSLEALLDQVIAWSDALAPLRRHS